MYEKVKKQVVTTQCLSHHIFLEIYIFRSLVVWPVNTIKPFIRAYMQDLETYIHNYRGCGMAS